MFQLQSLPDRTISCLALGGFPQTFIMYTEIQHYNFITVRIIMSIISFEYQTALDVVVFAGLRVSLNLLTGTFMVCGNMP